MNLPNYFLADLPPEATLGPTMITEACQTLRRNREQYLAPRSTMSLLETLSDVAANWLEPHDPFRQLALQQGPGATGFPEAMLRRGLDTFFRRLTAEGLRTLVEQDLGQLERLDRFAATEPEQASQRTGLATGPELLVHISAGNLPIPALTSLVMGLLVKSAQFVKCATGTSLLPRLLAHSLYAVESKLASCLEIAEWRGGTTPLEEILFAEADGVTATGTDETLAGIRARLPARVRFLGYGHRVSFGYVSRDVLSRSEAKQIAARAAHDIAAWNQQGCLSPHLFYVEEGGTVSPSQFAGFLAAALAHLEAGEPRGAVSVADAAAITSRRNLYEVRAAASPDTQLWRSEGSTAWTVVYEADPLFQYSCLNRFVYVKAAKGEDDALHAATAIQGQVSTVGLAACGERARELTFALARWGATRVCPIGHMQDPPLAWRHDGRPALAELITWTDCEH
jgi:hypothetical protein